MKQTKTNVLNLKHLSTYLPFGVKFKKINSPYSETLTASNIGSFDYKRSSLILRELETLDSDIVEFSKVINFYEIFMETFGFNDDTLLLICDEGAINYENICNLPKYAFDFLIENHFDVFGLIEKTKIEYDLPKLKNKSKIYIHKDTNVLRSENDYNNMDDTQKLKFKEFKIPTTFSNQTH